MATRELRVKDLRSRDSEYQTTYRLIYHFVSLVLADIGTADADVKKAGVVGVVVERSNGPSHACNSSNLACLGFGSTLFFSPWWSRAQAKLEAERSAENRAEQGRAGQGGRAGRSVIVSHLRSLIPDRGPTPAPLGVGLSPLRYLVCSDCLGLPTPVFFVDWIFCPVPDHTSTSTRTHPNDTSGPRARPPLRHNRLLLTTFNFFVPLPARWLALLYQEPTSPPPPLLPLLSKHAAESRRSAA